MINKKAKGKEKRIVFIVSVCITFILIYGLNRLYPLFSDDWFYSFFWTSDNSSLHRVDGIRDIIISQYNHYMAWGGRSVVHAIDQLLLMQSFPVICLLNSLAYIVFVYLLYKIANKENNANPFLFILFNLLIWFFQPAFFETIIWKTGSANYLWGGLLVFMFMYPYYLYYQTGKSKDSSLKMFLYMAGGIVAGWTNENMAVALVFFIVIILIISKYKKVAIPKWAVTGLIGVIIGASFLLLSPGNYIRLEGAKAAYNWQDLSMIKTLWIGTKVIMRYFVYYLLPILGIYILLLIVYCKDTEDKKIRIRNIYSSMLFIVTGFVALLAMVATPVFPERALFGIIILFLVPIGIIYANIDFKKKIFKYMNIPIFIILLLLFGKGYYQSYVDLQKISSLFNERELYIEEQKSKGIDSLVFTKEMAPVSDKYFIWDLTDDPNGWTNKAYARFHGLRSVCLVPAKKKIEPNNQKQ